MRAELGGTILRLLGVFWLVMLGAFLLVAVWHLVMNITGQDGDIFTTVVFFIGAWSALAMYGFNRIRRRALRSRNADDAPPSAQ